MYTINSNQKIVSRIDQDLGLIIAMLLEEVIELSSVILVGGFGRGEGSVVKINGKYQPINDYDIAIIGKAWKNPSKIGEIRHQLTLKSRIRHIDLSIIQPERLKDLKYNMSNFDLKYGSRVVYGPKNILDTIPEWSMEQMPKKEAITPLFLYLSSLLQSYPSERKMTNEDIFWSYQQLTKSILGWSTALLIFEGSYHPSYRKRNEVFQEIFDSNPLWCNLVQQATDFKLAPILSPIDRADLTKLWSDVTHSHLQITKTLISKFYKTKTDNWDKLILRHKFSFRNNIKRIYSFMARDPHYMNCLTMDIAKLYLCLGLSSDCLDMTFIKKSVFYLTKLEKMDFDYSSPKDIDLLISKLLRLDINASLFYKKGNKIEYV